ncbi:hypothetical protein BDZ45DRAFT_754030 [Acephala macrosclerotiorum]|nr:hypothetical protein BDZ45DRAFT_754030 [Acephala macrosclerotiorum]
METLEAIERLEDLRKWGLDVMLVNHELWPTWIYMLKFTRRIEQLSMIFRIIGWFGKDFCGPYRPQPSVWGQVEWTFYDFLQRLLKLGPVRLKTNGVDKKFVAEHLIFNGLSHDGMVEMWKKNGTSRFIGAQFLAGWMESAVELLVFMAHNGSTASFSAILYERVGTIEVQLDGKTCQKWDLGERLRKL